MQYTEQDLVAGCLRNDRKWQERFYRCYFATMHRMVRRHTADEETILHILNTGFLRVFQKLDTFKFEGSLEGWVRRLVFHALSDFFRKDNRRLRFLDLEERDRPTRTNVVQDLYFDDLVMLVKTLPPATETVFRMYAIEGYNHPEIADRLGISVGTSKWHLSNARKLLQAKLANHENYRTYGT